MGRNTAHEHADLKGKRSVKLVSLPHKTLPIHTLCVSFTII